MIEARGRAAGRDLGFLEVSDEMPGRIDTEEVVDVGGRCLGFGPALRNQGIGGHAAGAGVLGHSAGGTLEPEFEGERRAAQLDVVPTVAY